MKFKKNAKPVYCSDTPWYELTCGGRIQVSDLLFKKDAQEVCAAITLVLQFIEEAEEKELFEYE